MPQVKLIFKQLIVHNDLAIGHGTVFQQRGPNLTEEQQIELTFIFRTIFEIRALDICRYTRVQLHQPGCNLEYWYNDESEEDDDGLNVLKPDSIPSTDPGRWILIDCGDGSGGGGELTTASNIGTGIGVFDHQEIYDLQFKSIVGTGQAEVTEDGEGTITINVPDECECIEIIVPEFSCTALTDWALSYASYYNFLTRNYFIDGVEDPPGSNFGGYIVSAIPIIMYNGQQISGGPRGDAYDQGLVTALAAVALPFDTCNESIFSWQGGSPANSAYQISGGQPSAVPFNDMTFQALVRTTNSNGGVVFTTFSSGGGAGMSYVIKYHPNTPNVQFFWGNVFDDDASVTVTVAAPVGWSAGVPNFAFLFVHVQITNTSVTVTSWINDGTPVVGSTTTTTSGNFSIAQMQINNPGSLWNVAGNLTLRDCIFGHGSSASGQGGFTGAMLWTGIVAGKLSGAAIQRAIYAFRQNTTTWNPAIEEPPPPDDGYILVYNTISGKWELEQAFPGGNIGQFLIRTGLGPNDVAFVDLPKELPAGGTTVDYRLAKASATDYDVEWVIRDSKTFFGVTDPDTLALPGDLWYQGTGA